MATDDSIKDPPKLTKRQIEVLKLFCDGMDDKTIAEQLFISKKTVRVHIHDICRRMGLDDNSRTKRTQLLIQIYGPALKRKDDQTAKIESNEALSLTDDLEDMVEKDENISLGCQPQPPIDHQNSDFNFANDDEVVDNIDPDSQNQSDGRLNKIISKIGVVAAVVGVIIFALLWFAFYAFLEEINESDTKPSLSFSDNRSEILDDSIYKVNQVWQNSDVLNRLADADVLFATIEKYRIMFINKGQ